ncbi:MAG TPA: NADH:flavin oxidoreductase/NADH oxidase [Steroidobacteraceae bacterium]
MSEINPLFEPLALGTLELPNRIVVAPMCQYSASDGSATDWHLQHWSQLGYSGAGWVVVEATAVERRGRITHGCLGLYSDDNEATIARALAAARRFAGPTRFGIQLAHAGRKASNRVPWLGGGPLPPAEDPWQTVGPSAVPYAEGWNVPHALTEAEIEELVEKFVAAARRAVRAGFDIVELHCAHGYLLHEFLSPLSNQRTDRFGGSLESRMRFPLMTLRALREALPSSVPLGIRVSATDWVEGGWDIEQTVRFVRAARDVGVEFVCASSGGNAPVKVPVEPGYQVPFAERIKREVGIKTRAVGLIVEAQQAAAVVAEGRADLVALARAFLDDPRWGWHAADALGATAHFPSPYHMARSPGWKTIKDDVLKRLSLV